MHPPSLMSCLFAGVLAFVAAERTLAQGSQSRPHAPGELLIGFETEQDRDQLIDQLDETRDKLRAGGERPAGVTVERRSDSALKLRIEFPESIKSRLRGNPEAELTLLQELARQLKASNSKVKFAHPNWILSIDPPADDVPRSSDTKMGPQAVPQAAGPNDPIFRQGKHWHYMPLPIGMNAVGAWNARNTGSKEVVVAVLDTGLVFDHPDIKVSENVLRGRNMLSSDFRQGDATDTGDPCPAQKAPPSWHGTHVAGTIGAVGSNNGIAVTGINWSVTVLPVRVLGPCGGHFDDIADGIRWAAGLPVNGVPRNDRTAHIISLSLGGKGDCTSEDQTYMRNAVAAARARGVIVVVAAGNANSDVKEHSPAGCPGVISVAASDRDGKLAYYSNFGAVTIMAPGGDTRAYLDANKKPIPGSGVNDGIFSVVKVTTLPQNPEGIASMEGTSMAAPHVSGAIALALAKHPDWRGKPDLVAQKLRASASKPPQGGCPQTKPCGSGQLDAARLMSQ
jgi:subtilisin family serine protease